MESPFMSEFMYSAVPSLPTWKPNKSSSSSNSNNKSRGPSQRTDSNGSSTTTGSGLTPTAPASSPLPSSSATDHHQQQFDRNRGADAATAPTTTTDNNAHARSRRSLIRSASRSSSSNRAHHYWLTNTNSTSSANDSATSINASALTTNNSRLLDGRQHSSSPLARARSNSAAAAATATNRSNKDATTTSTSPSVGPARDSSSSSSSTVSARTRLTAASLSAVTSGTSSTSFTPRKQKHKSVSSNSGPGGVNGVPPLPVTAAPSLPSKSHASTTAQQHGGISATTANSRPLFHVDSIAAGDLKHVAMYPDVTLDAYRPPAGPKVFHSPSARAESVSSTSLATAQSSKTVLSSDPSAPDSTPAQRPFVQRNGRSYLRDQTNPYPLPVDLTELHRQSLRTLLLIQVHGAPVASPALTAKPPLKVLDLGCGSGFWSMMCHRYFKSRGHGGIHFTGVDVASVAPSNGPDGGKPDRDMKWTFVQHDLRVTPWPFANGEFDMVFNKDMALACTTTEQATLMDESIRVLKSGGTLEIWETDHSIRMLRKHVPSASAANTQVEEQEAASTLGAYVINTNTPLSPPQSAYLQEYNGWLKRAMDARELMVEPCTVVNHSLLSEAESLKNIGSHRVAIPFSEVRWEREGVGGIVTKDGKSYPTKSNREQPPQIIEKKSLTAGQAALRRTALLTLIEEIQALEPLLREQSGKSQDEWDVWMSKMTTTLLNGGDYDTRWGECLESGAWWATKR